MKIINRKKFIQTINGFTGCRYREDIGRVEITCSPLPNTDYHYKVIYRELVKYLSENKCESSCFSTVKVKDIILSNYSNCLLRYAKEVIEDGIKHYDTCWFKRWECSRLIGPDHGLDLQTECSNSELKDCKLLAKAFKNLNPYGFSVNDGWLRYTDLEIEKKLYPRLYQLRLMLSRLLRGRKDRICKLIETIKRDGFDESKAYGIKMGCLGFSKISNDFSVFHGKHRVVALRYLYETGFLSGNYELKFPIIEYSMPHFGNSAGKCTCV